MRVVELISWVTSPEADPAICLVAAADALQAITSR